MHNTDTSIEENKVPDKEDAVHRHVSDTSRLPSERPATSIISEYEVSVFRDVEETVTVVPDIVCNNGLDIGDMVVENNETEERIAWFLEGTCASCYIAHYAPQFIASMLQEAHDECHQKTWKKLVKVVMGKFRVSCSFVHFDIVSIQ